MRRVVFESRSTKLWAAVTLAALFAYNLYWLLDSFIGHGYDIGFGMIVNAFKAFSSFLLPSIWVAGHSSSTVGLIIRFCELTLALFLMGAVFLGRKNFSSLRNKISLVFLLEGVYFLCLALPATMLLWLGATLYETQSYIYAGSYYAQILLTVPLIFLLSLKVRKNDSNILMYAALALVSYFAAVWINNNFRWLATAGLLEGKFVLSEGQLFGFANGIICLSLALLFVVTWCTGVWKKGVNARGWKMLGLGVSLLGAHFLIYLIYAIIEGSLGSVMLVEMWMIPLLALGASLILEAQGKHEGVTRKP
jgi:hypothetical protein